MPIGGPAAAAESSAPLELLHAPLVKHSLFPYRYPRLINRVGCITYSATEGNRPQMLSQRSKRGHREKEQPGNDDDRPEQETSERKCVVAQGAESEWSLLLVSQRRRHRHRRDDRQVAAEDHHQARHYIPRPRFRSRVGIAVKAVCHPKSVKGRAVVGRGRRELVNDLRKTVGGRVALRL